MPPNHMGYVYSNMNDLGRKKIAQQFKKLHVTRQILWSRVFETTGLETEEGSRVLVPAVAHPTSLDKTPELWGSVASSV